MRDYYNLRIVSRFLTKAPTTLRLLAVIGLTLALTESTIASSQLERGERVATVTKAFWVKVRTAPQPGGDTVLTMVAGGTQLRLLDQTDDWFRVQLQDGRKGWISKQFSRLDQARDLLEVSETVVRLRQRADITSGIVAKAVLGLQLEPLETAGEWDYVRMHNGTEGWVRSDLVSFVERSDPVDLSISHEVTKDIYSAPAGAGRLEESTRAPAVSPPAAAPRPRTHTMLLPTSVRGADTRPVSRHSYLVLAMSLVPGALLFALILFAGTIVARDTGKRHPNSGERAAPNKDEAVTPPTLRADTHDEDDAERRALESAAAQCLDLLKGRTVALLDTLSSSQEDVGETTAKVLAVHREIVQLGLELSSLEMERLRAQRSNTQSWVGTSMTVGAQPDSELVG